MGRKRKLQDAGEEEESNEVDLPPKHLTVAHQRKEDKRLIVILENAQLETAKVSFYSSQFENFQCQTLLIRALDRSRFRAPELRRPRLIPQETQAGSRALPP